MGKTIMQTTRDVRAALKAIKPCVVFHFGPMYAEKGLQAIRECRRSQYACRPRREAKFFRPALAKEFGSRLGLEVESERLPLEPLAIQTRLLEAFREPAIVGIDEAQFLYVPSEGKPADPDMVDLIVDTLLHGMRNGCEIHLSGLDADSLGIPFPVSQALLCDPRIYKRQLTAVCAVCLSENASMTQRLYKGEPAPRSMPTVILKGQDAEENLVEYEPRCPACHEIPD